MMFVVYRVKANGEVGNVAGIFRSRYHAEKEIDRLALRGIECMYAECCHKCAAELVWIESVRAYACLDCKTTVKE